MLNINFKDSEEELGVEDSSGVRVGEETHKDGEVFVDRDEVCIEPVGNVSNEEVVNEYVTPGQGTPAEVEKDKCKEA